MSLAKSADRLLNTSRRVLNASMTANVLMVVLLAAVLSQGVLIDYSDYSKILPRLVRNRSLKDRLMMLKRPSVIKMAVVLALAMGVMNVGLMNIWQSMLKAAYLK